MGTWLVGVVAIRRWGASRKGYTAARHAPWSDGVRISRRLEWSYCAHRSSRRYAVRFSCLPSVCRPGWPL